MSAAASVCRAPESVRSFSAERRSLSESAYWPSPTYVFAIVSSTSASDGRLSGERAVDLSLGLLQSIDQRDAAGSALPRVRGAEGALQKLVDRRRPRGFLLRAVARTADLVGLDRQHDGHADEKDERRRGSSRTRSDGGR